MRTTAGRIVCLFLTLLLTAASARADGIGYVDLIQGTIGFKSGNFDASGSLSAALSDLGALISGKPSSSLPFWDTMNLHFSSALNTNTTLGVTRIDVGMPVADLFKGFDDLFAGDLQKMITDWGSFSVGLTFNNFQTGSISSDVIFTYYGASGELQSKIRLKDVAGNPLFGWEFFHLGTDSPEVLPTPEPAIGLLLGSGVVAYWCRRRFSFRAG